MVIEYIVGYALPDPIPTSRCHSILRQKYYL